MQKNSGSKIGANAEASQYNEIPAENIQEFM